MDSKLPIKRSTTSFPRVRTRRLRSQQWIRNLVAENAISVNDLILPIFIHDKDDTEIINAAPNISRYSFQDAIKIIKEASHMGINAVLLFPIVEESKRSFDAKESFNPENTINRFIKTIKKKKIEIGIIADVALDPYTIDGHDGISVNDYVDNDITIDILKKQALSLAVSGADAIAPSDMMDGRVAAIREYLDANKFYNTLILSYSAKFCSSLYSPFRSVIKSKRKISPNKSSYQINIANTSEAISKIHYDVEEGADCIIIKPALTSLDIVKVASQNFQIPIIGYMVSGEYCMVKQYALEYESQNIELETILSIKRAGANAIITYNALDIAKRITSIKNKPNEN